jgi:hypothetical protein
MDSWSAIAQMPPGFRQAALRRSEKATGLADASKPSGTRLVAQYSTTRAREAAMPCAVNSRIRPASVDAGRSSRPGRDRNGHDRTGTAIGVRTSGSDGICLMVCVSAIACGHEDAIDLDRTTSHGFSPSVSRSPSAPLPVSGMTIRPLRGSISTRSAPARFAALTAGASVGRS